MSLQTMFLDMTFGVHVRGGMASSKAVVAAVLWVGERDDDAM
jgi:hypothetical protein